MKYKIDKSKIILEMDGAVSGGEMSSVPIASYGSKSKSPKQMKDNYTKKV